MASNTPNLDKLYSSYKQNQESVPFAWQVFFAKQDGKTPPKAPTPVVASTAGATASSAQNNVSHMIQSFRSHGHASANLNPLKPKPELSDELKLASFGLNESQMGETFATDGILPATHATLKEIVDALTKTYTSSIGVQYLGITDMEERRWLRERMETIHNKPEYTKAQKTDILEGLMRADKFENFLHTKYVGVKRFSAEGGDAIIPMMYQILNMCGEMGVEDVVAGMAHRGRMNVLANIMRKPFEEIFAAFNDSVQIDGDEGDDASTSDVKYHMGKSYDVATRSGNNVHISLQNNPSHLEMVNPVVQGSARARQQRKGDFNKVLPITFHGDTAFAGQGVVPETLNLANLEGYTNGGSIRIVINNQIGFTAEPEEAFSGEYCTDIARMLQVPIFHVNGEDAEACVWVAQLAMEYRMKFNKDAVIDLVCYRKYGHNEGDDPTFTQPLMYAEIKKHHTPYQIYKAQTLGQIDAKVIDASEKDYQETMLNAFNTAKEKGAKIKPDMFGGMWEGLSKKGQAEPKTNISEKLLTEIASTVTKWPKGFTPNPKIKKGMEKRQEMLDGKAPLDWGAGETAAHAALLAEGFNVRLSGQDVQRGTFSHRHIVNVDVKTGERFAPFSQLANKKVGARLEVHNSCLSELAVLGFEFGHSLADPNCLTVWEAQFGDFANGAQIMIDQFISSSESKWHRMSGLVMSLPHGMEGMGPEHSSARMERYLQLCAQNNMTVAYPTTPSQIFHLLRRQMHRKYRRPLVYMSPKSLLRHPLATSSASDLTTGGFQEVIADDAKIMANATKVALCSGKVYYDLLARRNETKDNGVALIRIEQLYPVPLKQVEDLLKQCKKAKEFMWVQEETRNQGAWGFLLDTLFMDLKQSFRYVGRIASPSPAVGSPGRHRAEQNSIIDEVFSK